MGPKNPIYYCQNCKDLTEDLESLLFVEDQSSRGFCSEQCIEEHYQHLVDYFSHWEASWREKANFKNEDVQSLIGQSSFMNRMLGQPDEVWMLENGLQEKMYSFIKSFNDPVHGQFSISLVCFMFEKQPSFILAASASRSEDFINEFRIGDRQEDFELRGAVKQGREVIEIDERTLMAVESKKSLYLADMIDERSPADIPFESFHLYESFFDETMREPDEIYLHFDTEGDQVKTYIKAHEREGISFYYFIVCLDYDKYKSEDKETLIPILSFPTLDGDMYRRYRKGQQISGSLKS